MKVSRLILLLMNLFAEGGRRSQVNSYPVSACKVNGNLIPRFDTLRWVPMRFRGVLPLAVMKRYKCVVVGVAPGVLTVALAQGQETFVPELLSKLTGCTIFPVLIPPGRMGLLMERMERANGSKGDMFRKKLLLYPLQTHSIVMFTAARWKQHK